MIAFGGTAQTYCRWTFKDEPYKDGKVLYIDAIHPLTKQVKKVRWYTDKKHADLMPSSKAATSFSSAFCFKDENDRIVAIKEKDLSRDEALDFFHGRWRFAAFFGGIWYSFKDTSLPPVQRKDKFFFPTWEEVKAEGQKNSTLLGIVPKEQSKWFQ